MIGQTTIIWIALAIGAVSVVLNLFVTAINVKLYTEVVKWASHERRFRKQEETKQDGEGE